MNGQKATLLIIFLIFVLFVFFAFSDSSKDFFTDIKSDSTTLTLNDLDVGCFGLDCIPSIDNPKFESVSQADEWLNEEDLVFGVNQNGVVRAYPQRILNWHEIVNDTLASQPVAITFCPLCGSAIAFERLVDGVEVEFGISGRLHNSNLVMYDRSKNKSYWQQATGKAIIGPAADRKEELKRVSIAPATWGQWKVQHLNTEVLSRDTGFVRDYSLYPYGAYEENGQIYYGIKNLEDKRLPIKEIVYGFDVEGVKKAYLLNDLQREIMIIEKVGEVDVKVELKPDGEVTMVRVDDKTLIIPLRTFWFAWAAFYPDTLIYKK